jgi:hypothetical protein
VPRPNNDDGSLRVKHANSTRSHSNAAIPPTQQRKYDNTSSYREKTLPQIPMKVARAHVRFDTDFLKKEEERKKKKEVISTYSRSVWILSVGRFRMKQRMQLRCVDSYRCCFYPSLVSQKLLKMADARTKESKHWTSFFLFFIIFVDFLALFSLAAKIAASCSVV